MNPQALPDEQLVTLYQTNTLKATTDDCFETLYNRYVGKVYQQCLNMTKDADMAQDFTQDIFIKVFNKLDRFEQRSKFSTWLYSISHHYCLDQLRRAKRLPTEPATDPTLANIADTTNTDEEAQLEGLNRLLASLPTEEVRLLDLRYKQNLPIQEIATITKLSVSAVKMRLKRSRDKLHVYYQQLEE